MKRTRNQSVMVKGYNAHPASVPVNPLRKKWAKWCVGPKNCLRIFKSSKSANGKGIHSGPKHLSHGLNSIDPRTGRMGKVGHIRSLRQQKLNGK